MTTTPTAPFPAGTLQQLDPTTIAVDRNVRKHVNLDRSFLSNIKQRGVIQPPTVYWDEVAGGWQVLDGQRRVLAAQKAGHATIPAVIVEAVAAEDQRITDQLAANEHRQNLADVDKAAAFGELALFGMSSDAIQRRINLPESLIQTGIKVSQSKTAAAVAEKHPDLGIEQAEVFVEFENDDDAIADLREQLKNDSAQLLHVASRIRLDRKEKAERAAITAELTAKGIEVVDADSFASVDKRGWRLDDSYPTALRNKHLTLAQALERKVPVVARLYRNYKGPQQYEWAPTYYVLDGAQHGLFAAEWIMRSSKQDLTEEEREQEKVARRTARENTKAWRAASDVRLEFVKSIYQRKELPLGWTLFALTHLIDLTKQQYQSTWIAAAEILGTDIDKSSYGAIGDLQTYIAERPQNASQIMLAIALAVVEGQNEFATKGWSWVDEHRDATVRYLELLQSWGYTLSEIEQHIIAGTVPA